MERWFSAGGADRGELFVREIEDRFRFGRHDVRWVFPLEVLGLGVLVCLVVGAFTTTSML